MKIKLEDVTIKNEKNLQRLVKNLNTIREWDNFDSSQMVRIYVNSYGDFIGWESEKYNINFVSTAHRLNELKTSTCEVDPVEYDKWHSHVLKKFSETF